MRRGVAAFICAVLVATAASMAFVWWAPAEERALLPFAPSRSCVVAVTDDTDFFQFGTTAPVYALIDSLGLRVTKTVWAFDHIDHPPERAGLSLENPDYRAWVVAEAARGHEIALHSATAGDDERDTTIAAHDSLARLLRGESRIVIFHSVNREAFYWGSDRLPSPPLRYVYERRAGGRTFEGATPSSQYYWVDASRRLARYVRGYTTNEVNTLAVNPSMPYEDPLTPDAPLWCASSNGRLAGEFVRLLAPRGMERLKRERGVSIVYTHFASGFTEPSGTGADRLTPEARETLVRCGTDRAVEFAPAGEVLDRLRAIQFLEDVIDSHVAESGPAVVTMPPELMATLGDVSVVPSRLPAPLDVPSVGAGVSVTLETWLAATGWRVRAGHVGVFDGARSLRARERYRMVLRWLAMSLVTPSYGYESGA